jgi:hypothetical protein
MPWAGGGPARGQAQQHGGIYPRTPLSAGLMIIVAGRPAGARSGRGKSRVASRNMHYVASFQMFLRARGPRGTAHQACRDG